MEVLLPTDIAKLVFGYLVEEKCDGAALLFLETCDKLKECETVYKAGRRFSTKVLGFGLIDILNLYTDASCMLKIYKGNGSSTSPNELITELENVLLPNSSSEESFSKTVFLRINVPTKSMAKVAELGKTQTKEKPGEETKQKNNEALRKDPTNSSPQSPNFGYEALGKSNIPNLEDFDINIFLENTALHERLAENINKAMDSSGAVSTQEVLHNTEVDPIFDELLHNLVEAHADTETTTPEDTDKENGDPADERAPDIPVDNRQEAETMKQLEEESNLAVAGILANNKKGKEEVVITQSSNTTLQTTVLTKVSSSGIGPRNKLLLKQGDKAIVVPMPDLLTPSGQTQIVVPMSQSLSNLLQETGLQRPSTPLQNVNNSRYPSRGAYISTGIGSSYIKTSFAENIPTGVENSMLQILQPPQRKILPKSDDINIQLQGWPLETVIEKESPPSPVKPVESGEAPLLLKRTGVRTRGGRGRRAGSRGGPIRSLPPHSSVIKTRAMMKKDGDMGPTIFVRIIGEAPTHETEENIGTNNLTDSESVIASVARPPEENANVRPDEENTNAGLPEENTNARPHEENTNARPHEENTNARPHEENTNAKEKEEVRKESLVGSTPTQKASNNMNKRVSLSTPRRGSHIRVLDFKTPMRDKLPRKSLTSPKAVHSELKDFSSLRAARRGIFKSPPKEKNVKKNWDADLRKLISAESMDIPSSVGLKRKNGAKKLTVAERNKKQSKQSVEKKKKTKDASIKSKETMKQNADKATNGKSTDKVAEKEETKGKNTDKALKGKETNKNNTDKVAEDEEVKVKTTQNKVTVDIVLSNDELVERIEKEVRDVINEEDLINISQSTDTSKLADTESKLFHCENLNPNQVCVCSEATIDSSSSDSEQLEISDAETNNECPTPLKNLTPSNDLSNDPDKKVENDKSHDNLISYKTESAEGLVKSLAKEIPIESSIKEESNDKSSENLHSPSVACNSFSSACAGTEVEQRPDTKDKVGEIKQRIDNENTNSCEERDSIETPTPLKLSVPEPNENSLGDGHLTPSKIVMTHPGAISPNFFCDGSPSSLQSILIRECKRMETQLEGLNASSEISPCATKTQSGHLVSTNTNVTDRSQFPSFDSLFQTPAKIINNPNAASTAIEMTPLTKILLTETSLNQTVLVTPTLPNTPRHLQNEKHPDVLATPSDKTAKQDVTSEKLSHIVDAQPPNSTVFKEIHIKDKNPILKIGTATESLKGTVGSRKTVQVNLHYTLNKVKSSNGQVDSSSEQADTVNPDLEIEHSPSGKMPKTVRFKILNSQSSSSSSSSEKNVRPENTQDRSTLHVKPKPKSVPVKSKINQFRQLAKETRPVIKMQQSSKPSTSKECKPARNKKTLKPLKDDLLREKEEELLAQCLREAKPNLFGINTDDSDSVSSDESVFNVSKVDSFKSSKSNLSTTSIETQLARERLKRLQNVHMLYSSSNSDESNSDTEGKRKLIAMEDNLNNFKKEGCVGNKVEVIQNVEHLSQNITDNCKRVSLSLTEKSKPSIKSNSHGFKRPRKSPSQGNKPPVGMNKYLTGLSGSQSSNNKVFDTGCQNESQVAYHSEEEIQKEEEETPKSPDGGAIEEAPHNRNEQIFHIKERTNFPNVNSRDRINLLQSGFLDSYSFSFTLDMDKAGNYLTKVLRTSSFLNLYAYNVSLPEQMLDVVRTPNQKRVESRINSSSPPLNVEASHQSRRQAKISSFCSPGSHSKKDQYCNMRQSTSSNKSPASFRPTSKSIIVTPAPKENYSNSQPPIKIPNTSSPRSSRKRCRSYSSSGDEKVYRGHHKSKCLADSRKIRTNTRYGLREDKTSPCLKGGRTSYSRGDRSRNNYHKPRHDDRRYPHDKKKRRNISPEGRIRRHSPPTSTHSSNSRRGNKEGNDRIDSTAHSQNIETSHWSFNKRQGDSFCNLGSRITKDQYSNREPTNSSKSPTTAIRHSSKKESFASASKDKSFYSETAIQAQQHRLHKRIKHAREDGELSDSSAITSIGKRLGNIAEEAKRNELLALINDESRASLLKKVDLDHFLSIVHGKEQ